MRLAADQIEKLIHSLARRGYQAFGQAIPDRAVVYDEIDWLRDLPRGQTDVQEPGCYRLKVRQDGALFGYSVGPQSWKKYLHPAQIKLFEAEQKEGAFHILNGVESPTRR